MSARTPIVHRERRGRAPAKWDNNRWMDPQKPWKLSKAYSNRAIRAYLRLHRTRAVIPSKADQPRFTILDRALYWPRDCVERLINRLKQFRRVAIRYEKVPTRKTVGNLALAARFALIFGRAAASSSDAARATRSAAHATSRWSCSRPSGCDYSLPTRPSTPRQRPCQFRRRILMGLRPPIARARLARLLTSGTGRHSARALDAPWSRQRGVRARLVSK
jgi:hypothetical protein